MDKLANDPRVQAAFLATFPLQGKDTPEQHVKRYAKAYVRSITEDFERAAATEAAIKTALANITPLQD